LAIAKKAGACFAALHIPPAVADAEGLAAAKVRPFAIPGEKVGMATGIGPGDGFVV